MRAPSTCTGSLKSRELAATRFQLQPRTRDHTPRTDRTGSDQDPASRHIHPSPDQRRHAHQTQDGRFRAAAIRPAHSQPPCNRTLPPLTPAPKNRPVSANVRRRHLSYRSPYRKHSTWPRTCNCHRTQTRVQWLALGQAVPGRACGQAFRRKAAFCQKAAFRRKAIMCRLRAA